MGGSNSKERKMGDSNSKEKMEVSTICRDLPHHISSFVDTMEESTICRDLPRILSSFVDTMEESSICRDLPRNLSTFVDTMEESTICRDLPRHLSSFVDTFIDFSVAGFFLLPDEQQKLPSSSTPRPIQTRYPSPDRLVAIGDLHGDLNKSKQVFKLAGLIDASDHWTGGNTTVVQIGDVLDRGGDEIKILYFLEKLKREASKCGGLVITMHGNHEIINTDRDFRFVTKSGLDEFKVWADWYCIGNSMKSLCSDGGLKNLSTSNIFEGIPRVFPGIKEEFHKGIRARIAALRPNGPISKRFLAENPTVLVIGDSVFVHGGLLQNHVLYGLERINEGAREWIKGSGFIPNFLKGKDAVVWMRTFSEELERNCDCATLKHVLATIPGAKRMIMGHTVQRDGISIVCDGRAIRIDVGLSKEYGDAVPEVLEIIKGKNSSSSVTAASSELYALKLESQYQK